MNRRSFLTNTALASAALGLNLTSGGLLASTNEKRMISREQYKKWFVFDGLGVLYDINDPTGGIQDNWRMTDRLRNDLLASGLSCYRQTTGAPFPAYPGDDVFETSVSILSQHHKLIDANSDVLTLVRN